MELHYLVKKCSQAAPCDAADWSSRGPPEDQADVAATRAALCCQRGASDFSERERERDRQTDRQTETERETERKRDREKERQRREAGRPTQTTSPGMLSKRGSPAQPRPAGTAGAAHPKKRAARRGYKCCGW
ncbi:hypothetical protein Celaphus_00016367 [Cervus elaphus hippelaphus]|uniref:Uncharacterized protein n=1 Tax=Cervus elaphus hippelaphus TaxID=46360 RepID=A0A212CEG7_CEREH|nr:hypothetical protein Celaphus_00016367 [Cervus elaphus hippelaphus]